MGAGLDGLQLGVRVLHRPGGSRARAEPAAGRDRRRGHAARRRRRQRDHAARPERELVGPRPRSRHPDRVRRAAARLRRGRRHRAHPIHEPAPEGLPRARDRGDRRVRERLRARPPAAQSGSSRVLKAMRRTYDRDRYLRLVERAARRDSRSRARHRPDRRLPRRDGRGLRADARRSSRRCASTARSRSSSRRAPGTEAAALPDQVPDDVKHERLEALVERRPAGRRGAQRRARRPRRGGARRGPEPHGPRRCSRGRTRRNTTVNFAGRGGCRAISSTSSSRASTSTTLRGRVAVARRRLRHATLHTFDTIRDPRVRLSCVTLAAGGGPGCPAGRDQFGATRSSRSSARLRPASRRSRSALAGRLGTEVVSADALQVYRGLAILTNQPHEATRLVAIRDLARDDVRRRVRRRSRTQRSTSSSRRERRGRRRRGYRPLPARGARRPRDPAGRRRAERARARAARTTTIRLRPTRGSRDARSRAAAASSTRTTAAASCARSSSPRSAPRSRRRAIGSGRSDTRRPTLVVGLDVPPDELERRIAERTGRDDSTRRRGRGARGARAARLAHGREGARARELATLPLAEARERMSRARALCRVPAEVDAADPGHRHDRRRPTRRARWRMRSSTWRALGNTYVVVEPGDDARLDAARRGRARTRCGRRARGPRRRPTTGSRSRSGTRTARAPSSPGTAPASPRHGSPTRSRATRRSTCVVGERVGAHAHPRRRRRSSRTSARSWSSAAETSTGSW